MGPLNINTKDKIPVVLLFGPTAVGKTDLLLELFKDIGEVINADSMQVYNDLDIGSAKPTEDYVKKIPHHLVSIVDANKQFSVAEFVEKADKLTKEIYSRGKIPVISGGTAFYFKNFMYGLPKLPEINADLRLSIQCELESKGLDYIYNKLESLDPDGANSINSGDTYRVTRALEVFLQSGKSILEYDVPKKLRENYKFLTIGLERPREELYNRIDKRVDIMFDDGLIKEFIKLYKNGVKPSYPGMKGIGYSEFFQFMSAGCWSFYDLKDEIRRNSRRYAKRQITFFKSFADVKWFNPELKDELKNEISEFIKCNTNIKTSY